VPTAAIVASFLAVAALAAAAVAVVAYRRSKLQQLQKQPEGGPDAGNIMLATGLQQPGAGTGMAPGGGPPPQLPVRVAPEGFYNGQTLAAQAPHYAPPPAGYPAMGQLPPLGHGMHATAMQPPAGTHPAAYMGPAGGAAAAPVMRVGVASSAGTSSSAGEEVVMFRGGAGGAGAAVSFSTPGGGR
jgi:hypothetical protein